MKINDKVKVNKNIPNINGMLYKGSIVKIDEIQTGTNPVRGNIRVIDSLGKIWWLNKEDLNG
jgi:hypothetical protein